MTTATLAASPTEAAERARRKPKTMIVPITPPDIDNFRPAHTEGDTDFDGNGPFVHIVVEVQRKANLLVLATSAFFQETKSDWTTFEGTQTQAFYDVHVEHPGWRIQSIVGMEHQSFQNVLMGYGQQTFTFGIAGLVNTLVLRGDSDGGAFGGDDHPGIVSMSFNEIQVRLVRD